jgi:hypothetical protein
MHKHEEEALSCLQSCVSHQVNTHQVDAVKKKLKAVEPELFRCKYCKRNYKKKSEASSCAAKCKPKFTKKHNSFRDFRKGILEGKGIILEDTPQGQIAPLHQCATCGSKYHTSDAAMSCYQSHMVLKLKKPPLEPNIAEFSSTDLLEEIDEENFDFHDSDSFVDEQSSPKEMFTCPVCKEEYSSEADQQQCYATHFD